MSWRDDMGSHWHRGCNFRGVKMWQHYRAPEALETLIADHKPTEIIEIGTYNGALTCILAEVAPEGCSVDTFDIEDHRTDATKSDSYMFFPYDSFGTPGADLIAQLIRESHRCMLLCDGGDKVKEVNMFGPLLRPGDALLVHDYGRTKQAWRELGPDRWCCGKINDCHFFETLQLGFEPYFSELLNPVGWGCWIRR